MRQELDAFAVKMNRKQEDLPDMDDFSSLPFCQAVIMETIRFSCLNPFLKRELTGDIVTPDGVLLKARNGPTLQQLGSQQRRTNLENPGKIPAGKIPAIGRQFRRSEVRSTSLVRIRETEVHRSFHRKDSLSPSCHLARPRIHDRIRGGSGSGKRQRDRTVAETIRGDPVETSLTLVNELFL